MLIILQQDVILRHEFLDQITFKGERFDFAVHFDRFKIGNMRNHRPHFRRMVFRRLEILPHTVFQDLRLADIDHRAGGIQHLVYAGLFGKQGNFIFQSGVHKRSSVTMPAFSSISYNKGAGSPTTL